MKFKKILKSGTATRDQIASAINQRALKSAKKAGHSEVTSTDYEKAMAEGYAAYESTPKAEIGKREPRTARVTKAEAELDKLAKKVMKAGPGMSYAQACSKALQSDPALYDQYQQEIASGAAFEVPEVSTLYTQADAGKFSTKPSNLSKLDDDKDD